MATHDITYVVQGTHPERNGEQAWAQENELAASRLTPSGEGVCCHLPMGPVFPVVPQLSPHPLLRQQRGPHVGRAAREAMPGAPHCVVLCCQVCEHNCPRRDPSAVPKCSAWGLAPYVKLVWIIHFSVLIYVTRESGRGS